MLEGLIKLELGSNSSYPNIIPEITLRTIKKNVEWDSTYLLNPFERNHLELLKNQIDLSYSNREWDKAKKLSNPYELIHIPNRKIKSESISSHDPLSRSFFKLWEIIHYFGLLDSPKKIKTGHLAEGPGGFLEAVYKYRLDNWKSEIFGKFDDYFYGITLAPTNKDIPGWGKAYNLIRKSKPHIEITYGVDHTGNIYKSENLNHFSNLVDGAELITADGGFDFSVNFNFQEQSALQLIYAEVLGAIMTQKKGGHFVCKFFDTYSKATIKLIYLIKCLYTEVFLFKPLTSRPANSEKYLIAKGFKDFDNPKYKKIYLQKMKEVLDDWGDIKKKGYLVLDIFGEIPEAFYQEIIEFNHSSFKLQSIYISKTLQIIKDKPKWSKMKQILHQQVEKAIEWCQSYSIPINTKSYFYQKYLLENQSLEDEDELKLEKMDRYYENFLGYEDESTLEDRIE